MQACHHTTQAAAHPGALSTCESCSITIIYTGAKWSWPYDLGTRKLTKLYAMYQIDQMTGKHAVNVP